MKSDCISSVLVFDEYGIVECMYSEIIGRIASSLSLLTLSFKRMLLISSTELF